MESNLVGSAPSEDIVTGNPVIIGFNPNITFKSFNLYLFLPVKPFPFMNSLNSLCVMGRSPGPQAPWA